MKRLSLLMVGLLLFAFCSCDSSDSGDKSKEENVEITGTWELVSSGEIVFPSGEEMYSFTDGNAKYYYNGAETGMGLRIR